MSMLRSQVISELSRLFSLEMDAVEAYRAAALHASGALSNELALHGLEHQRHVLDLQEAILALGVHPPEVTPDVKGVVIGALTAPRRKLTDEDVLEAVRGNEQLTNSIYAKVLAKPLPQDVRVVVERARSEERSHLEWAERMLSRGSWAGGPAHP
jgi:hypothetical protein